MMDKVILKKIVKFLFRPASHILVKSLSGFFICKMQILRMSGRWPNLNNPQTYTDKLLLYMSSDFMERCSAYADKIAVREYVKDIIGPQILSDVYGVYDSCDEIDFTALPEKFYLKTNHGSGWNLSCSNKEIFIRHSQANKKKTARWLRENYYKRYGERQYKNIQPKLYIEEYLDTKLPQNGQMRIFVFSGKAEFIQVTGTIGDKTIVNNFYNCCWELLPFVIGRKSEACELKKPDQLEEMILIAEALAKPFPFVRVDLYHIGKRIIFSELTFSPSAAVYAVSPGEWSYKLGNMFPYPFENCNSPTAPGA